MKLLCTLGIGMVAAAAGTARGDTLAGALEQPLWETDHEVAIKADGAVAILTVRRTIHNAGEVAEEADLALDLPEGAVATALRLKTRSGWTDGDLLAADEASEEYDRLTGMGDLRRRKDPAILEWVDVGKLMLRVFPVEPGGESTVEYDLTVPLEREDGRPVVYYPAPGASDDATHLEAPVVRAAGKQVALVRDDERGLRLSLPPPAIDVVAARFGRFAVNDTQEVWRLEVDAAQDLVPPPKNARVVFVVDASRSVGAAGVAEQVELARGYLADLPDARYEMIFFRRDASRLAGEFVSAGALDKLLDRAARLEKLAPGNGSNLDVALALAATALREGKHKGDSRIVILTDGVLRQGFSASVTATLLAQAPKGTIVNIARRAPVPGTTGDKEAPGPAVALAEARDDADPLAPLASAYGGVVLAIRGSGDSPAAYARVARGLVTPIRIDELRAEGEGVIFYPQEGLAAGEGARVMGWTETAPAKVRLRGKIWAQPWSLEVVPDAAFSKQVGILIFGDPLVNDLPREDVQRLAFALHLVSPETSYLAVERGAKPAGEQELLGRLLGDPIGDMEGGGDEVPQDGTADRWWAKREQTIAAALAPAVDGCAALDPQAGDEPASTVLELEATGNEVVDVSAKAAATPVVGDCLIDQAWTLALGDEFLGRHVYQVTLRPEP